MKSWPLLTGLWMVVLALSLPSRAALGGDVASVRNDAMQMKGTLEIKQGPTFSVHEMKVPGGTLVREYMSAEGKVFGVSWQGPFIPDMQQLLGDYFQKYSETVRAEKARYVGRRPLNIHQPELVVESSGHMRSYYGRIYDPQLVPANVKQEDIR